MHMSSAFLFMSKTSQQQELEREINSIQNHPRQYNVLRSLSAKTNTGIIWTQLQNTFLTIKTRSKQLEKIDCSWVGLANIIKMTVLPTLIYLFGAIPIKLPKNFFIDLEKSITKFIWRNKISRIPRVIMKKKCEGMWPSSTRS